MRSAPSGDRPSSSPGRRLRDGGLIHINAAKTAMVRAWAPAGISKPRPWKTLRATFATRKAEKGANLPDLAA